MFNSSDESLHSRTKVAVLFGQQAKHDIVISHYTHKTIVVIGCETYSMQDIILKAVASVITHLGKSQPRFHNIGL